MKKLLLIFAFAMIFTEAAQAACASYTEEVSSVTRGIVEGVQHYDPSRYSDDYGPEYERVMFVHFAQGYVGGKLLTCFSIRFRNSGGGSILSSHFSIARETAEKALLSGFLFNSSSGQVSLSAP